MKFKSQHSYDLYPKVQYLNKGAVAGFLPATELNLRTALGVEICKLNSAILSPAFGNRFRDGYL